MFLILSTRILVTVYSALLENLYLHEKNHSKELVKFKTSDYCDLFVYT